MLEAVAIGAGTMGNRMHATRGRVLIRAALDRDTGALEPREALLVVDLAREFPARSEEPVVRAAADGQAERPAVKPQPERVRRRIGADREAEHGRPKTLPGGEIRCLDPYVAQRCDSHVRP